MRDLDKFTIIIQLTYQNGSSTSYRDDANWTEQEVIDYISDYNRRYKHNKNPKTQASYY